MYNAHGEVEVLDAGICFSSRPRQTFSNSQPEQEKSLHISYNVGLLPVGEAVMFVFDGFDGQLKARF